MTVERLEPSLSPSSWLERLPKSTTVALRFMYSLVCLYYGYEASKDWSEILNLDSP